MQYILIKLASCTRVALADYWVQKFYGLFDDAPHEEQSGDGHFFR